MVAVILVFIFTFPMSFVFLREMSSVEFLSFLGGDGGSYFWLGAFILSAILASLVWVVGKRTVLKGGR